MHRQYIGEGRIADKNIPIADIGVYYKEHVARANVLSELAKNLSNPDLGYHRFIPHERRENETEQDSGESGKGSEGSYQGTPYSY
jgi:hypothetical protein